MKYINAVIENKSEQTDCLFTYSAPDEVQVGARLTVPFAFRKKAADAYCVETDVTTDYDPSRIKEIESYVPDRSLNQEMISTAMWMKQRYGVKYIDAIRMFTVPGKKVPERNIRDREIVTPEYELTEEQQSAVNRINSSIESGKTDTYLIKGVTNSGKTEVYMQAVERALSLGKTAIVLLPEIALAAQVEERFKARFGDSTVATLHSKLSTGKKLSEWLRIRSGEAGIVIGARTSVFAPIDNIGVIVIDEEHETTYKSDHNPKYETVDIAYKRAEYYGATLVLGSATPSVVSYYRAEKGIYKLIEMKYRVGDSIMPELEIADMRKEARLGNTGVISYRLTEEISRTLKRREQVILFLNRRGYSTQILCPDCGYRLTCDECGISLTYHRSSNAAVCHYCGRKNPLPAKCPDCGSHFIKYVGAGTEKVEEAVISMWPEASVARFDLDIAVSEREIEKTISDFQHGKTDILVGTQILAKGLDFRNVGLVGIINADVSLNIPDYRSSERTFQLITQVSGRAGRTGGSSRVIVQTYDPESEVIQDAVRGDYESFCKSELLHRNIMNYPPYSDIISVSVVEKDKVRSENSASEYAEDFRRLVMNLKGAPQEAVVLRTREEQRRTDGRRRFVFIIKAPPGSRAGYIRAYLDYKDRMMRSGADCYIEIDVNPYGMV